jgi:hypothetical protein
VTVTKFVEAYLGRGAVCADKGESARTRTDREKEIFSGDEGKALLKKWGLSDEYVGVGALALGYADCELPSPAKRKDDYIVKV